MKPVATANDENSLVSFPLPFPSNWGKAGPRKLMIVRLREKE
jgi:hypothetical protein